MITFAFIISIYRGSVIRADYQISVWLLDIGKLLDLSTLANQQ